MQSNVGFDIGIRDVRGGSGGGVPFGLSGGTLFLDRHTGLAPCQVIYFYPDLTFSKCVC